jgi:monoamine oxidase
MMRVIVVGAGFAGLAAAWALRQQGQQVTVLEARQRVGGRIWSPTLANGAVVEMGGEWIAAGDQTVLQMAAKIGVAVAPVGVDFMVRQVVGGEPVAAAEQRLMNQVAAEQVARMGETAVSQTTLGSFINTLPLTPPQLALLRARLRGTYGADLDTVALRTFANDAFGADDHTLFYRFADGNQRLAEAMAAQVGDVRLGHGVTAVCHTPDSVTVHCLVNNSPVTLTAAAVVLAVPITQLPKINFDPALPNQLAAAMRRVPMGVAAKLAVAATVAATVAPPSLRAVQDVVQPYWCWTGQGRDGVVRTAVTAFSGSTQALENLRVASGHDFWLNQLRTANPDLALIGEPWLQDWSRDPWAQGCYTAWDNASWDSQPLLAQPHGRLFFAGEHTSVHSGTMEGALASGLRAANQAVAGLSV